MRLLSILNITVQLQIISLFLLMVH
jgi:hypothetical protein